MRPIRISGADPKPLNAPPDWNEAEAGHCGALFIRRETLDGINYMRSAWEVDGVDVAFLLGSASLTLGVSGSCHPVVQLGVSALPDDFEPVVSARRYNDPQARACVRVEMLFPYENGKRAYADVLIGDAGFAAAVALGISQIEGYARKNGWTE